MLLRYIVSNFGSIGHPIEFSMLPTEDNVDDRFLKVLNTKMGPWKVLQRGGLFGPNASGKSTLIKSIAFAKFYITREQKSKKNTRVPQFKGDFRDLKGITTFQFTFFLDNDVYEYSFSMDKKQIREEWLTILKKKGFSLMFERFTDENSLSDIKIYSTFARKNSKDRNIAEILKLTVQENQKNQLFLYKLAENGIKKAEKIIQWFEDIQIIFPNTKLQGLPIRVREDANFRAFISKSLNSLDTGVCKITATYDKITFNDFIENMNLPKEIINDIEETKNGIINLNGRCYIFSDNEKGITFIQIKFEHNINNKSLQFNIEDESDGTKRLLDLLPILFIKNTGNGIFFIDELDRSLHTKLSKYILKEFIKNEKTLSQIIFTAHDVNLINLDNFRQDEIWFIDKNNIGESKLKPLSDFILKDNKDIILNLD